MNTSSTFQILIDNKTVVETTTLNAFAVITIAILAILAIIIFIWKKLQEDARLKYEFITIVAHKFRTPLTYVKWVCDDMIPSETDQFKKKNLADIKRSNQQLIDLTGTLIEIADSENSKSSSYSNQKIPLCSTFKEVADKVKGAFHEKNIFLGIHCDDESISIKADTTRLEFVFATLLENACIYTPPGKNVDVTISANHSHAYIAIQDGGIGISKEDLPYIFTKFFRGKNARANDTEGFGVGLYLASSIVKHFKGKIKAESTGENKGARFTVILPRVK